MQIERRADGLYFRFYLSAEGFTAATQWYGPFAEDEVKGAAKALYRYGYDRIEKSVDVGGEVLEYAEEKYLSEVFLEPSL